MVAMVVRWFVLILFLVVNLALSQANAHFKMSSQICLNLFADQTEIDLLMLRPPGRQGTGILQKNWNPEDPFVKNSITTNYNSAAEVVKALAPLQVSLNWRRARTTPILRGSDGHFQISVQHSLLLKGDRALWPLIDAQGNGMGIYSLRGDKKPPYLIYFHVGKSRTGLISHSFMVLDSVDAAFRFMATHDFDATELQRP